MNERFFDVIWLHIFYSLCFTFIFLGHESSSLFIFRRLSRSSSSRTLEFCLLSQLQLVWWLSCSRHRHRSRDDCPCYSPKAAYSSNVHDSFLFFHSSTEKVRFWDWNVYIEFGLLASIFARDSLQSAAFGQLEELDVPLRYQTC